MAFNDTWWWDLLLVIIGDGIIVIIIIYLSKSLADNIALKSAKNQEIQVLNHFYQKYISLQLEELHYYIKYITDYDLNILCRVLRIRNPNQIKVDGSSMSLDMGKYRLKLSLKETTRQIRFLVKGIAKIYFYNGNEEYIENIWIHDDFIQYIESQMKKFKIALQKQKKRR